MHGTDPPLTSTCKDVNVDGLTVRCRTAGTGSSVLLLHGWGGSMDSMATISNELTKTYTVYSVDLPGHGRSDLPPKPWGTPEFTSCVLRVMDLLDLQSPDIVGHSFGGRLAIHLAALHPERVGRLVLVDSAGVIPPRRLKYRIRVGVAKFAKFLSRYGGPLGQKFRNYVYGKVASKDYISAGPLRDSLVRVVNEDLTPLMPHINKPTLLVWGRNDEDTPVSSALTMQKLITGAQLVVLENAGHFSYIDQKNQFDLHLKRFLRT